MAPDADPYRTLGLPRDATLDEVRRAYRRLAKANHPDAAGEAALPRFLAIQSAYDTIVGPDAGTRRPASPRPGGARRAWDAERDRTDATYRAYGGRSRRRPSAGGSGAPGSSGGRRSTGGPPPDPPPGTGRPPRPARPPNKATLGSTSYDGAEAEPFEPDWGGASWYGTTSGTYWTLNPKEYADPRKHGPEYQARARRKLSGRDGAEEADAAERAAPGSVDAAARQGPSGAAPSDAWSDAGEPIGSPAGAPIHEPTRPQATSPGQATSTWWEATGAPPPRPEASAAGARRRAARERPRATERPVEARHASAARSAGDRSPGISTETVLDAVRAWLDDARPGALGRVVRGLVGWAPIALGVGWLGGEISGCGRFAAGCDDTVATTAWLAQVAILVVLLSVGRLSRIASVATLTTLTAAVPAALLLSATGSPEDAAAGRLALSGLLVIAWVVGLVFGVAREVRSSGQRHPARDVSGPAGPVS